MGFRPSELKGPDHLNVVKAWHKNPCFHRVPSILAKAEEILWPFPWKSVQSLGGYWEQRAKLENSKQEMFSNK